VTISDALVQKLIRLAVSVRTLEQKEGYNLHDRLVEGEYTEPAEVSDLMQAIALVGDDTWMMLEHYHGDFGMFFSTTVDGKPGVLWRCACDFTTFLPDGEKKSIPLSQKSIKVVWKVINYPKDSIQSLTPEEAAARRPGYKGTP
jgi:hypothetical protein